MYVKCTKCEFNVLDSDEACPNCGKDMSVSSLVPVRTENRRILNPPLQEYDNQIKKYDKDKYARLLSYPLASGTTLSFLVSIVATFFVFDIIRVFFIFAVGTFVFAAIISELKRRWMKDHENSLNAPTQKSQIKQAEKIKRMMGLGRNKPLAIEKAPKWSLQGKNETAQMRIKELGERKDRINYISKKIKATNNENLRSVREKLSEANEVIDTHIGRYRLQKLKVQLALIQNDIVPYMDRLFELTEAEAKAALKDCRKATHNLKNFDKKLHSVERILLPRETELEEFRFHIKENLDTITKLEESLLNRKAMLAIQGIRSIEDNFDSSDFGDLAHRIETFTTKSSLIDFSKSFDELESEYERLRAENETSQKLLEE